MNLYLQQGEQLNNSDQNIEFILRGNNNYQQIRKAYIQHEWSIGNLAADPVDRIFTDGDATRPLNIALAYTSEEANNWGW